MCCSYWRVCHCRYVNLIFYQFTVNWYLLHIWSLLLTDIYSIFGNKWVWTKYFHKVLSQSHNSAHSTQNLHSFGLSIDTLLAGFTNRFLRLWLESELRLKPAVFVSSEEFIGRVVSSSILNCAIQARSRNSADNREKAMFVDWRIFLFNIYSTLKAQMCYSLSFQNINSCGKAGWQELLS